MSPSRKRCLVSVTPWRASWLPSDVIAEFGFHLICICWDHLLILLDAESAYRDLYRDGTRDETGRRWQALLEWSIDQTNSMNRNLVYKLVKQIPRGQVATYGQIARILQLPGGARSAGRAMAVCPSGRGIPWHRVVGAGGRLLLRDPHVDLQRKLLESEGLRVAEKRIENFSAHEWRSNKTRTSHTRAARSARRRR
jgi:methylated-DNA-protein-cysteine methyltransferase-like protein